MKRSLFFLYTLLVITFIRMPGLSQTPLPQYESEWQSVEAALAKGLPQSALKTVDAIFRQAKTDGQQGHVLKALVYRVQLEGELGDKLADTKAPRLLEAEIAAASEPVRSVLYSLQANWYFGYYTTHQWELRDRTATTSPSDDLSLWSATDFLERIEALYLKSLEQEAVLKQTAVSFVQPAVTPGKNTGALRPALYDLLAHRAIEFFQTDAYRIRSSADFYPLTDTAVLAPAAVFVDLIPENPADSSADWRVLRLFQQLLRFHLNDPDPAALIDADLQRLAFVYGRLQHPDKTRLYRAALQALANRYTDQPGSAQVVYLLALQHFQDAARYQRDKSDSAYRLEAVRALAIAEEVLKKFPETEGGFNAQNLKNDILQKELAFDVEKVNIPGKPFRISLAYKNTAKVYFRLIRATQAQKESNWRQDPERFWTTLSGSREIAAWEQEVPDFEDHQSYRTELKVDALPVGEYILVASSEPKQNEREGIVTAGLFYVSGISYVNQGTDYFVLDRETGAPLAGAGVQVWRQGYNTARREYELKAGERLTTDSLGYCRVQLQGKTASGEQLAFKITHGKDTLFINERQYHSFNTPPPKNQEEQRVFFFTDRSIYRPGQDVHFKGILMKSRTNPRGNEVVPDRRLTVSLTNVNGEKVDSLQVTTNDMGSFSGVFALPVMGLNGRYTLAVTSGTAGRTAFNVEEYKRPKFEVAFDTVTTPFRVADTIRMAGRATAYAGNVVEGAKVSYRVVRTPRFPYPWRFMRGWWPPVTPAEIAHGETITAPDGTFEVLFQALPDRSIRKELDPVFDYMVYADVTDTNGETRSGRQTVSVSYKPVVINATIPEQWDRNDFKALTIRTENLAGAFVQVPVQVTIRQLVPEQRLIRNRYWERPDVFVLSKDEFVKAFPHDEYDQESDWSTWKRGEILFAKRENTRPDGTWPLELTKTLNTGFYELVVAVETADGEEVKEVKRIELIEEASPGLLVPQYLWSQGSKPIAPGETTQVLLGTSASDIFVIQTTTKDARDNSAGKYDFFKIDSGIKPLAFGASAAEKGGYGVSFLFVKHNRVFEFQDVIRVPWTEKELKLSYETFRDKTLPGSTETWTIRIAGIKGEQVAAEFLGSMYDASLDQFMTHQWTKPSIWPEFGGRVLWNRQWNFAGIGSGLLHHSRPERLYWEKQYEELMDILLLQNRHMLLENRAAAPQMKMAMVAGAADLSEEKVVVGYSDAVNEAPAPQEPVQVRSNFNETAFFYPELRTDHEGNVSFSFTMPEALTRWKFQGLAHTRDLAFGYSAKQIITQKELMVQPNIPRFVRVGDAVSVGTKVVNLSDKPQKGTVTMQVLDAGSRELLDEGFSNTLPEQPFELAAGQSKSVFFGIRIPQGRTQPVLVRIVARGEGISDGEEHVVPVLSNQLLVTEAMPLRQSGSGSKAYRFEKLSNSAQSTTLRHHSLTLEYTANPAWNVVQALPYLMEYQYDCSEQTWNRYYANALATHLAGSIPRLAAVLESWKNTEPASFVSNLEKNPELKALVLEETPWVMDAGSESEQQQRIALLFDLVRMRNEAAAALAKLTEQQKPSGAFPWFKGGHDNYYISQYILTGIGHLRRQVPVEKKQDAALTAIARQALAFADAHWEKEYQQLIRAKADLKIQQPGPLAIQYLYMRSFFTENVMSKATKIAHQYYLDQVKKDWVRQNKYMQAMIALTAFRTGDARTAKEILASLKETAVRSDELGVYWKRNTRAWWWQDQPIEEQALLAEAFDEIASDSAMVDGIRTWLLSNKQTNRWESTKATAAACYALLLRGTGWLEEQPEVTIQTGQQEFSQKGATGTGYFKERIPAAEITAASGAVTVQVESAAAGRPSWGAVYWQYFEDLDKITAAATPLVLRKKLFVEVNTAEGPLLKPVGTELKTGDKVVVRIELEVDRDMEFVHMNDMRASGLEPVNVISGYKLQGGLFYYETTKDAGTHFFFDHLPKGNYVFEYPLRASNPGDFSNGITRIQCLYAPEFTAHSEGSRLIIR